MYQVGPAEPATFAGIRVLLGLLALLAWYPPARRAARVSPSVAPRNGPV
jgi:putative ABC transport system permease protein